MNASVVHVCRLTTRAAAALAALVGLCGLLEWVLGVETLKAVSIGGITIKANSAICLMLCGIALFLLAPEQARAGWARRVGLVCAAVALVTGGLTLAEHLTGLDFAIDELLFHEPPGAAATVSPGRMGPPASASFFLVGLSLLLLDVKAKGGRVPSQWLALLVSLIALLPLIGYAYSIQPLYGISRYTGIAVHTAVAILALGVGLLVARPTSGIMAVVCADDVGGMTARRLLLPAILLPFFFGWLRTIGQRYGVIDEAFGRPMLILALTISLATIVWWNARRMSLLAGAQSRAEDERRRSDLVLRSSERQLQLITDTAPIYIAYGGADLRFRFVNRQYAARFGLRPEDVIGRPIVDVIGDELYNLVRPYIDAVLAGREIEFELEVPHRGLGRRWLQYRYAPDFDERGEVRGWVSVTLDVSKRKQDDEALRQAKEQAERASEAKSQFLATLSHELRTPLTPVLLTVSLMESHPHLPADLRDDVATIRRNVELESRLISDLLDLTRVERGKLQLDEQEVDLHLIVRAAVDICQREASARLTLDLKATRHTVRGDSTRLQQVFWNLINNAIKFTGAAGAITVRSSDAPDGRVRVDVTDTGVGIDPDVMPKLFTAFEQGDARAARQQAGLGLGLSISRKLVEAHGGTISAESAGRGHGATFSVELPTTQSLAGGPVLPWHEKAAAATTSDAAPMRPLSVLLVEDHEPTLAIITRLLRGLGHQVTGTTSLASASAAAGSHNGFDLIISGLGLPDGSGLDLMRRLHENYAGRAIALTGYGMESDVQASREAGFVEHLTKPIDLAALQAAIGRVVR